MKELLKSLSEAKKEIGAISKDSKNPFFKSKYFDINQLLEHVEPILEERGLMITQPIIDNKVFSIIWDIETGQNLESGLELPTLNDPQKLGSCITYYRRYTLSSLLAIQAEDDDANKASRPVKKGPLQLTDDNIESAIMKGTLEEVKKGIKVGKFTATPKQLEWINNQ
jgi:hypothetical protein